MVIDYVQNNKSDLKLSLRSARNWMLMVLLFLLTIAPVRSQVDSLASDPILVKGKLLIEDSSSPVPFAHLVNMNRYWGAISDTAGNFSLYIYPGDTLSITAIGFAPTSYVLPDYVSVTPYNTRIYMQEISYPLAEVEVFVFGTYEQFKEKVLSLELPETRTEKLGKRLFAEAKEIAIGNTEIPRGFSFSLPSKFDISLRKLQELEKVEERQMELYLKYNREIIARTTGFEGEELDRFIIFCNERVWFTPETSAYDIIVQIKIWYSQYLNPEADTTR
jgi:hypothetical protein